MLSALNRPSYVSFPFEAGVDGWSAAFTNNPRSRVPKLRVSMNKPDDSMTMLRVFVTAPDDFVLKPDVFINKPRVSVTETRGNDTKTRASIVQAFDPVNLFK
jgi:hypothetical protein